MNKVLRALLVIFVLDLHCIALGKSLRSIEDALAGTKMNMMCKSDEGKEFGVIENGVIANIFNDPPINQVSERSDFIECWYEMPNKGKPTIEVKVSQSPAPLKNANVTIRPFASNPTLFLEGEVYKGNFTVDFVCFNPGNANARVSMNIKIENGINIDIAVFFTKNCGDYILKYEYIYMKKKADTNLISNQGFISPNFHPYNDDLFVDDVGSVTYIILSGKLSDLLECSLREDYQDAVSIKNGDIMGDETIDEQRVIEIIFSGQPRRIKVTVECNCFHNGDHSFIAFSFIKDYKLGPLPGFDVLVDDSYIVSQYAVINDGIVTAPFSGNDRNGVTISSNKQCLVLHFRSRYGITNYTVPVVKGAGVETTVMGQAAESRSVGKQSQKFIICHQCKDIGINHVKVAFDIIYAEKKNVDALPKLVFEYDKDCASSSKYPITITPGIFSPTVDTTYVVKKGVVSPVYQPGIHLVKARWDEERSRFYIENEGDRDLVISYPTISTEVDSYMFGPTVSIIGYDEEDEITLNKETGAKILEVDYNCNKEGEYHLMVEFLVDSTPITFSWMKICKNNPYSYSVRTSYEGNYDYNQYNDNDYENDSDYDYNNYENDPKINELYGDVVYNGRVQGGYSSDNTEANINSYIDEQSYYFVAGDASKLQVLEKPHIKSNNKKVCEVKVSGSIFDVVELSKEPKELNVQFKCKKEGLVKIDVVFTIGRKGKVNNPTTFSFVKVCSPETVNLNFLKDVIILVACVSIVFLLYPYVLACFPDTRWLRPWSYFRSYTRIPSKEN